LAPTAQPSRATIGARPGSSDDADALLALIIEGVNVPHVARDALSLEVDRVLTAILRHCVPSVDTLGIVK
jgi:hypothetical protein